MSETSNYPPNNSLLGVSFEIMHEIIEENKKKLFQEAIESTEHGYVLYISPEEITNVPTVPSVNRHYLKLLTFLYLDTFDAFIEGLASLPGWQNVPSTIIVDGLNKYCSGKTMQNACGAVALLLDTTKCCSRILKCQCRLIVSIDRDLQSAKFFNLIKELYGQLCSAS